MENDKIYVGFLKDFVEPTVLFLGQQKAFALFANFLRTNSKKVNQKINFREYEIFLMNKVEIILHILPEASGMKKIKDGLFEWGLSSKECEMFAEEFDSFATAKEGAMFHQYLDCNEHDDVVVMASIGEYNSDVFTQ